MAHRYHIRAIGRTGEPKQDCDRHHWFILLIVLRATAHAAEPTLSIQPNLEHDTRDKVRFPTVAALDALWLRVAAKPLWAPPNFFRYLTLRGQMRLSLIDPQRVRVLAPPGMVNDCTSCRDNCCIGSRSTVLLRLRDVATIIDLGREELIATDKPQFSAEEIAGRPALQRQLQSDGWRSLPVLKQNNYHACVALTDTGKCSLYPHWPLACSRFPYAFDLDRLEVFYSQRCDSFWIRHDGRANARVEAMKLAAVASYNERIKDSVLLAYAHNELEMLGLTRFVR